MEGTLLHWKILYLDLESYQNTSFAVQMVWLDTKNFGEYITPSVVDIIGSLVW